MDVEEDYHVDEIVDYDDGTYYSASNVCIGTNDWGYVESGEELQVEEPGNGLVPNGDGPKSRASL